MPADSKGRRNLLWVFGLFLLILISVRIYSSQDMDSLPAPFTIEINGSPIAKVDANAEDEATYVVGYLGSKRYIRMYIRPDAQAPFTSS